jgi:hypothetical protein
VAAATDKNSRLTQENTDATVQLNGTLGHFSLRGGAAAVPYDTGGGGRSFGSLLPGFFGKGGGVEALGKLLGAKFFAQGGEVSEPTLAVIGEGNHREAVVPLDGEHGIGGMLPAWLKKAPRTHS